MGVIHQWMILFKIGGRSILEGPAEIQNNIYPWLRAKSVFFCVLLRVIQD